MTVWLAKPDPHRMAFKWAERHAAYFIRAIFSRDPGHPEAPARERAIEALQPRLEQQMSRLARAAGNHDGSAVCDSSREVIASLESAFALAKEHPSWSTLTRIELLDPVSEAESLYVQQLAAALIAGIPQESDADA